MSSQLCRCVVVRHQLLHLGVGAVDVLGITRQRRPAERPDAAAEQRPDIGRHEAREGEGIGHAFFLAPSGGCCCRSRPSARRACGTPASRARARPSTAWPPSRRRRARWSRLALPLRQRPALRQIAVDRIVRRGLVGHASPAARRGAAARAARRRRCPEARPTPASSRHRRAAMIASASSRSRGLRVEVAGAQAHLDAARPAFDGEARGAGHRRGQRLRAAHAAQPRRQDPAAGQAAAVVLAAHLDEGLVGALHDALAADVDPRARGHLAEHHQALAVELVEMLPGRPVRHQVGVGDQHARRVGMRAEHADRLARLHQQGLVGFEIAQRRRRCGRSTPSRARRGRCRHRPRARRASRPPRDRGCSSACAAALRSASSWP